MKALRLQRWKSDAELVEVDEPRPGPGQVVVCVGGAGACHSDLHLMHDLEPGQVPWEPPYTLGHENAGWVHEVGSGVTSVDVGQPVAVYGAWGCGTCSRCLVGAENYCETGAVSGGLGTDGGMAELLLVPDARHLLPLPEGLDPVSVAPLTDAALTSYHAVHRSRPKLVAGSTAVVIGVGGLGHLAVQIIKVTTDARVVAVDTRPAALDLAEQAGADVVLRADSAVDAVSTATGGHGAEVVLDFVGTDATLAQAAAITRGLGDLTIVGVGGGTLPMSFFGTRFGVSVQTVFWGTRPELVAVLDLAARGLLRAETTTFPLDHAMDAYRLLESGEVVGRAVIVPAQA